MVKSKSLVDLNSYNKTEKEKDVKNVTEKECFLKSLLEELEAEENEADNLTHVSSRSYVSLASSKNSECSYASESSLNYLSRRSSNRNGNKTFNEDKLRDIEYKNSLLMNKIISQNRRPNQFGPANYITPINSHTINRRKKQDEIEYENRILLKKIQRIKPSIAMSK